MTGSEAQTRRFVVIAPAGRDSELICGLLKATGYLAERCASVADAAQAESSLLLGLILTDEALLGDGIDSLRLLIESQPDWSDLPVLLLSSGPSEPGFAAVATRARIEIRSLFLLDRPIRKELLVSAVRIASNSRLKQLEVRDAADRQYRSDETLRNTERLAVAGSLAATMAHEVNNPLEALSNLLFLVEHSSTIEEARSYAGLAAQELHRVSEIVDHTLRFHRAPAKPGFAEMSEIASSALALFRGKLRERRIRERIATRPAFAYCSAGEIRQALVNLIGNALDAMPEGGSLHLRVAPVTLGGVAWARITVADTGSGIRSDIRSCLFSQFFTTKGSRGTGLGLWLTRDIVLRNRARLRFRSRVQTPTGTVFSMYIPANPPLEFLQPSLIRKEGEPAPLEAA
ncbi:MAG TPA: ATP-binding protein [Terracidiphilus sp.]|nr:ATP-binding protein [Terracidiphilus sp.]